MQHFVKEKEKVLVHNHQDILGVQCTSSHFSHETMST